MPARLKTSTVETDSSGQKAHFPDLNPDALQKLTNRIASDLGRPEVERSKEKQKLKFPSQSTKKKHKDNNVTLPSKETSFDGVSGAKNWQSHIKSQRIDANEPRKKRLRDGQIKPRNPHPTNDASVWVEGGSGSQAATIPDLMEEVFALGGTQDDYELIMGVQSDSEVEGKDMATEVGNGRHLEKNLRRLVQDLGIDNTAETALDDFTGDEGLGKPDKASRKPALDTSGNEAKLRIHSASSLSGKSTDLHFEPRSDWYSATLPDITITAPKQSVVKLELTESIHQHAKKLLEFENKNYAARNKSASSSYQFYSTVMTSGTLSDKISAFTLSVQESPLHNLKALESLIGLARKRNRGQAIEVLGALKDLFGLGALLPSDRKLRTFACQPGLSVVRNRLPTWTAEDPLPSPLKEVHLICWAYEDWLKSMYFEVLQILEIWSNDEVGFATMKAVDYIYQLLKEKPEQEANLLRLLVNKLGDSDRKVASKTSYNILQLETSHPLMKLTIITSIESDILFRSHQNPHALYYAVITLNQTILSKKEETVAKKLLDIYFSLFFKLLEEPALLEARRHEISIPKTNNKGERQGGGGVPGKKAQQKHAAKKTSAAVEEDLREKLLSAALTGVNRAIPYTSANYKGFEGHLDMLFKVTHSSNFNTSIQALILIQQLVNLHQSALDRFHRTIYESLLDPRHLTSSKQALYLNLLNRALKSDLNVKRVKAFAKRLLQVNAMHQPSFACGVLYLLAELEATFPNLRTLLDEPEEDDRDATEKFRDVPDEDDPERQSPVAQPPDRFTALPSKPIPTYDGRKRDPEFSNAEKTCLWELTPFLTHYHPSVSLFASSFLAHAPMPPKPDLSLHTLIHFLDRFVYKNPKKVTDRLHGASIMQPMGGSDQSDLLVSAHSMASNSKQPVNTESFWRMEKDKVAADEVFFHQYFNNMNKQKEHAQKRKATKKRRGGDDSEDNDEDEDEIWKALVGSRPELEGGEVDAEGSVYDRESDVEDNGEEAGSMNEHVSLLGNDDGIEDISDDAVELEDDDDAFFESDDDIPSELEQASDIEDKVGPRGQTSTDIPVSEATGRKRRKKGKLKNLPTFASVDEYAALLDAEEG